MVGCSPFYLRCHANGSSPCSLSSTAALLLTVLFQLKWVSPADLQHHPSCIALSPARTLRQICLDDPKPRMVLCPIGTAFESKLEWVSMMPCQWLFTLYLQCHANGCSPCSSLSSYRCHINSSISAKMGFPSRFTSNLILHVYSWAMLKLYVKSVFLIPNQEWFFVPLPQHLSPN